MTRFIAWMRELRAGSRGNVMQETPSMLSRTHVVEDAVAARLLCQLPPIPHGAEARVRRAVEASRARDATWFGRVRRRAPAIGVITFAVAAAALFAIRPPAPPALLSAQLDSSSDVFATLEPRPGVLLAFSGQGSVQGTVAEPSVKWERGTLHVEVVPNLGIHFAVATREAEVSVIGTGFTVNRDRMGTSVEVQHGRVEVTCENGAASLLNPGDRRECLPRTAMGLIGRADALQEEGASAREVLEVVELGLALAESGYARDELRVRRIRALVELGRNGDARRFAVEFLSDAAGDRTEEVRSMLAALPSPP